MGGRCLRFNTLILFCVFFAFNVTSLTKTNSLIADGDVQTSVSSSLPTESGRTKRTIQTVIKFVRNGVPLIHLIVSNIKKSLEERVPVEELISHFETIQNELEAQSRELQFINKEIQKLGLSVGYSQHEEKIKGSLLALQEYLELPDEHHRNLFIEQGKYLSQSISFLIEGLLGQNAFSPDIMQVIRDAVECHGRELRKNVEYISSIIMTGLWVRGEYQRIIDVRERVSNITSSAFKNSILASATKLSKRLDDMLIECKTSERLVNDDMRKIMERNRDLDKKSLADSLLEFLESKYDINKWIVVLMEWKLYSKPFYYTQLEEYWKTFPSAVSDFVDSSEGFHKATFQNDLALALPIDGEANFSETINLMNDHFKEFQIPLTYRQAKWKNGYGDPSSGYTHCNAIDHRWNFGEQGRLSSGSGGISEHLRVFWMPTLTDGRLDVEMLSVDQTGFEKVVIVASKGAEYLRLPTTSNCPNLLVSLIPTKPIVPKSCSYNPVNVDGSGPLRNKYRNAYLSVKRDSSAKGAYIILDRELKNSSAQVWQFANDKLMNEFGKCLTAWNRGSWYLHQYDCHHNWPGQRWTRHGLQLVNGYGFCLDSERPNMYPIQNYCNSHSSFMWYSNNNPDC